MKIQPYYYKSSSSHANLANFFICTTLLLLCTTDLEQKDTIALLLLLTLCTNIQLEGAAKYADVFTSGSRKHWYFPLYYLPSKMPQFLLLLKTNHECFRLYFDYIWMHFLHVGSFWGILSRWYSGSVEENGILGILCICFSLALSFYIVVIRVDLSDMTSPRNATRYYIMHLMKSERIRESAAKQGRSLPLFSFSISNRLYRKLHEDESGKPNF